MRGGYSIWKTWDESQSSRDREKVMGGWWGIEIIEIEREGSISRDSWVLTQYRDGILYRGTKNRILVAGTYYPGLMWWEMRGGWLGRGLGRGKQREIPIFYESHEWYGGDRGESKSALILHTSPLTTPSLLGMSRDVTMSVTWQCYPGNHNSHCYCGYQGCSTVTPITR